MLVIKSVETFVTDQDPYPLMRYKRSGESVLKVNIITDLIKGKKYQRKIDGVDKVIGISQDAHESIGFLFEFHQEIFNKAVIAEAKAVHLEKVLNATRMALHKISSRTLLQRVKAVFGDEHAY